MKVILKKEEKLDATRRKLDIIRQNAKEKQILQKTLYEVLKDIFRKELKGKKSNLDKLDYITNIESKEVFKALNLVDFSHKKEFYRKLETLKTNIIQSIKKGKDFIEKIDKCKTNEELFVTYDEIKSNSKDLAIYDKSTLFKKVIEKNFILFENSINWENK